MLTVVAILPSSQNQPITVALNNLSGNFSVDGNVVMAGAIVSALPTALVYIFFSQYIFQPVFRSRPAGWLVQGLEQF